MLWRRRARRVLGCILAPAAVIPFIFLARIGYLQIPGHWDKFVLDDLAYLTIVSYVGSAIAAPVVSLLLRLKGGAVSLLRAWRGFSLVSCGIAFIAVLLLSRNVMGSVFCAVLVAVGSSAVALAYGVIAGLPWRAGRVPDRPRLADNLTCEHRG